MSETLEFDGGQKDYVNRPIQQIILCTDDLAKFKKVERDLLMMLGHASNEMAALYRAACAAGMEARVDGDTNLRQVARAQAFLMVRLALSKMHELIQKTSEGEYKDILAAVYAEFAMAEQKALDEVGRYMPLRCIRNCFGFHYDGSVIGGLGTTRLGKEKHETHDFIISRKTVNTFFPLSEFFYQKAFASALVKKATYEEFVTKIFLPFFEDSLGTICNFIHAVHCAMKALSKSVGVDLEEESRVVDTVAPFVPIDQARLPAFIAFRSEL